LPKIEPSKHVPKKGDLIFCFFVFESEFAPENSIVLIVKQWDDFGPFSNSLSDSFFCFSS
jgi:hypothetical protein